MQISMRRFVATIALVCLLLGSALFLNGGSEEAKAGDSEIYENIDILVEVLRHIEKSYVEPQDPQELIRGAIKGMVDTLDPHSTFLSKEERKELMIQTRGKFSGIGVEITIKEGILTVVSPIEGTPAYKAGMKAGDKIIKIDGEHTKDITLMEAVKKIRGPKGSEVQLTVMREGEDKRLEMTITRDIIPLKSVRHEILPSDIGYVRISSFQSQTAKDLSSTLENLEEGHGLKGMILDLRNNPGGLLSQAVKVSDLFLDSGVIVSTKARDSSQDIRATAHKNENPRDYPIVVLVNGGSASASEIVAGALQDNNKALILGTRTFGKGSVQTIVPLSDGSGLRLTTARYYTPDGSSIHSKGIIPDIEVHYVPPDKSEEEANKHPHFIREEDLENNKEETKEDTDKQDKTPGDEASEGARELLDKDNQVRQAWQLLQSWNVFSKIEQASK